MTRQSTYKMEYCEVAIQVMSEGDDVDSVAVECGVARQTIYNWRKMHPEFDEAMQIAETHYHSWWKKLGREYIVTCPPDIKFDTGLYALNMRNRCGWRATDPKDKGDAEDLTQQAQVMALALNMINEKKKEVEEMK